MQKVVIAFILTISIENIHLLTGDLGYGLWDKIKLDHLWMFLTEELGELAGAIRRNNNQFQDRKRISIEGEIMDVLSYLFQLAHHQVASKDTLLIFN